MSTLKWYAVPLLSIIFYIYTVEMEKAKKSGNWDAVFAGLALFGMNFINETWNGYSYKKVVTDKKYRYENMQYGRAEGLAMDNRYIYIVLDNNGDLRESKINDNRPLLLIFKNPFN